MFLNEPPAGFPIAVPVSQGANDMAVQLTEKALARLRSNTRQRGARRDATDAGCEGLQIRPCQPKGRPDVARGLP